MPPVDIRLNQIDETTFSVVAPFILNPDPQRVVVRFGHVDSEGSLPNIYTLDLIDAAIVFRPREMQVEGNRVIIIGIDEASGLAFGQGVCGSLLQRYFEEFKNGLAPELLPLAS